MTTFKKFGSTGHWKFFLVPFRFVTPKTARNVQPLKHFNNKKAKYRKLCLAAMLESFLSPPQATQNKLDRLSFKFLEPTRNELKWSTQQCPALWEGP